MTLGYVFAAAAAIASCSSDVGAPIGGEIAQASTKPPPPAGAPQLAVANHYDLTSGDLSVTYDRFAEGDTSTFVYRDALQTRLFRDGDVHVVSTDAGPLISVFLFHSVDSGSTVFSVLIPRVEVAASTAASVSTQSITTVHRFSIAPMPAAGQLDDFTVTPLQGSATHADVAHVAPGPAGPI
jgi:hypothetical protein